VDFSLRFKTSWALVVIAVLVLVVLDMLFSLPFADSVLSPWFVIPAFAVAWVAASLVVRLLPLRRE